MGIVLFSLNLSVYLYAFVSSAPRSLKLAPHAERMSPDYARLKGKLLLSIFKIQKMKKNINIMSARAVIFQLALITVEYPINMADLQTNEHLNKYSPQGVQLFLL